MAAAENSLAAKPSNLAFDEAAAVPQAAVVALQGLRDQGQIQAGEKVLINGASGGIGTFAVQIAKSFDAEVTGVCSTRNLDLLRQLGADHVIDYSQEDFTQREQSYDLIFDVVANRSVSDYLRVLRPKGSYVAIAFNAASLFLGPLLSKWTGKRVRSLYHIPKQQDLLFMKGLLEGGQVKPVIGARYPLGEVADAIRHLEAGGGHGKVVITVQPA